MSNENKIIKKFKWFLIFLVITSAPGKAYENIFNKFYNFDNSYQSNIFKKKRSILELSNYIDKDKKVYFIDQNNDEFFLRVARFLIYPIKSNQLCSSFVINKYVRKTYDCVISEKNFYKLIEDYDYLIFLNNNLQMFEMYNFNRKVKKIKKVKDVSLYEIKKND